MMTWKSHTKYLKHENVDVFHKNGSMGFIFGTKLDNDERIFSKCRALI